MLEIFTNPIALSFISITLIPVFVIVFKVIRNPDSEITTKWFSIKKTSEAHLNSEKIESLEKKLEDVKEYYRGLVDSLRDEYSNQIKEIKEENYRNLEEIRGELNFFKAKDSLKLEYKNRVVKLSNKFFNSTVKSIRNKINEGSKIEMSLLKNTDEFTILLHLVKHISYSITKKAMEDFERNGFDKVGLDENKCYNDFLKKKYVDEKPKEISIEVSNTFDLHGVFSVKPFTIIEDSLVERKTLISNSDLEKIIFKELENLETEIKDLYNFIISRYRSIHLELEGCETE